MFQSPWALDSVTTEGEDTVDSVSQDSAMVLPSKPSLKAVTSPWTFLLKSRLTSACAAV